MTFSILFHSLDSHQVISTLRRVAKMKSTLQVLDCSGWSVCVFVSRLWENVGVFRPSCFHGNGTGLPNIQFNCLLQNWWVWTLWTLLFINLKLKFGISSQVSLLVFLILSTSYSLSCFPAFDRESGLLVSRSKFYNRCSWCDFFATLPVEK